MNKRKIPTPDAALHDYFCDNEVFADVFNTCVFGEEVIHPEDLQVVDSAYSESISLVNGSEKLGKYRDIVRKTALGAEFIILGIENQDKIHYAMPLKVMLYDVLGYSAECKELGLTQDSIKWTVDEFLSKVSKGTKLTPLVTVVFYTGEEKWDGPRSLHDMLDISESLKSIMADYPIRVVDVGHDDIEFKTQELGELTYALKAIYNKSKLDTKEISNSILSLAGILAGTKKLYNLEKGGKTPMCNAIKEMALEEFTFRCLENGKSCEEIAEFANYPLEEVKAAKEKFLAMKAQV